ncbi:Sulfur carrier protein ThiS [Polaromonas vacuolata]|jgi:sulfur carrier protein|uniref:Sulfur carrier protein ThiS n=2 Tax=Polaromonas vacuolata TaxID=37448 RepID=A0A6H2H4G2_9BURK|nr:Sulfur carrier protein ThiS [Polaromonas vacuolata]
MAMTAPQTQTGFEITLNGKPLHTRANALQALLIEQGYALQGAFACAVNNSFVPRPQWPTQTLQAHDRVDVITPIAGG